MYLIRCMALIVASKLLVFKKDKPFGEDTSMRSIKKTLLLILLSLLTTRQAAAVQEETLVDGQKVSSAYAAKWHRGDPMYIGVIDMQLEQAALGMAKPEYQNLSQEQKDFAQQNIANLEAKKLQLMPKNVVAFIQYDSTTNADQIYLKFVDSDEVLQVTSDPGDKMDVDWGPKMNLAETPAGYPQVGGNSRRLEGWTLVYSKESVLAHTPTECPQGCLFK